MSFQQAPRGEGTAACGQLRQQLNLRCSRKTSLLASGLIVGGQYCIAAALCIPGGLWDQMMIKHWAWAAPLHFSSAVMGGLALLACDWPVRSRAGHWPPCRVRGQCTEFKSAQKGKLCWVRGYCKGIQ